MVSQKEPDSLPDITVQVCIGYEENLRILISKGAPYPNKRI
jgi:hypothetical protein